MRIALRKDDRITGNQMQGSLTGHLNEAFPFGDHMKDHHAFGSRFQQAAA